MERRIIERTIHIDTPIIEALKKMDSEGVKLLFVFNNNVFKGIITIGDIQRAIINNVDLELIKAPNILVILAGTSQNAI